MMKKEFESKLREVDKVLVSLCHCSGVLASSSLYGFLRSAVMCLDIAQLRISDFVEDLTYDEERNADLTQSV